MLITPWTQKVYIQWDMVRKELHFTSIFWILVQNFEIFDPMSVIFINITWTNKMVISQTWAYAWTITLKTMDISFTTKTCYCTIFVCTYLLMMSIPDEGYFRNVSCTLNPFSVTCGFSVVFSGYSSFLLQ
jgi:hypothetical protein